MKSDSLRLKRHLGLKHDGGDPLVRGITGHLSPSMATPVNCLGSGRTLESSDPPSPHP